MLTGRHYDNSYKDFTLNDFTYNINKINITYDFIYCYKQSHL